MSLLESFECGEQELELSPVSGEVLSIADDFPESMIPGYKIIKELHRGGQGVVYQAIQLGTKRKVAIKVLLEGPFAGEASKRRFEREVELVGSLQHPGIVPIFDSGVAHEKYFFAMEYVRGKVLSHHTRDADLSIDQILQLFAKVCEAVGYAHQKGVIHRDLKPSNILVDQHGEPRVVDFGLAKSGSSEKVGELSRMVSVTGQVMGTPNYMSPEQAAGAIDQVDMRSDVYSLGVILFELCTGQLPFKLDSTTPENLNTIRFSEPPPPRKINRSMSSDVETIVLKSMSKDRERRYPTAGALAEDIRHYMADLPISARRDSVLYVLRKSVRRHWFATTLTAALAVLLLGGLIAGWSLFLKARNTQQELQIVSDGYLTERDNARELRQTSMRNLYCAEMNLAAQALRDGGGISRLEELTEKWRPGSETGVDVNWEWYYFGSLCDLEEKTVLEKDLVWSCCFSPDGRFVASGGDSKCISIRPVDDLENGVEIGTHEGHIRTIAWSPNGKWVASGSIDETALIVDPLSKKVVHRIEADEQVLSVAWHPTKPQIAIGNRSGGILVFDVAEGREVHKFECIYGIQALDFSPDGELLAVGSWDEKLGVLVVDPNDGKRIFEFPHPKVFDVEFRPDGKALLACDSLGGVKFWSLQIDSADENDNETTAATDPLWSITFNKPIWQACWSPDGESFATAGLDRIVRVHEATWGRIQLELPGHTRDCWGLDWSSDGKWLLSSSLDRSLRIWKSESTTQSRSLNMEADRRGEISSASWVGDGKQAAISGPTRSFEVIDRMTGKRIDGLRFQAFVNRFSVSPSRDRIVGATDEEVLWWNIEDPSKPNLIKGNLKYFVHDVDWNPDGTRLVICTHDGKLVVWDLVENRKVVEIGESGAKYDASWHPARPLIAVASSKGVLIVNVDDATEELLDPLDSRAIAIEWSPDGSRLAIGTVTGCVTIHDGESFDVVHRLMEHSGEVGTIDWRFDGKRLATGSRDHTVRIWDTTLGQQTMLLHGHEDNVSSVDWSEDGMRLLSAGDDGQVRVWDAARGYKLKNASR